MAGFSEGVERGQTVLFPDRLEDWISEDALVRVVDLFVGELDLPALGFVRSAAARTGRPGFGGKLHAAVDRQHPRDLYDIRLLYENEGLTEDLFRTFLIYIACSSRPAHELLSPNFIDLDRPYTKEFEGMTKMRVSLDDLLETRDRLVADIRSRLDGKARTFLLSLHDGTPDFDAIERPRAADLPAVRWKLINLEKLKRDNLAKHAEHRSALEALFS